MVYETFVKSFAKSSPATLDQHLFDPASAQILKNLSERFALKDECFFPVLVGKQVAVGREISCA
jgi:hypothetical protein